MLILLGWLVGFALVAHENSSQLEWDRIADKIAERLQLQPGETVLAAVKGARFGSLIPSLKRAVVAAGGRFLGSRDVNEPSSQLEYRRLLRQVDAIVILPGPAPTDPLYQLAQAWLQEGKGRTIHFHWEGAFGVPGRVLPDSSMIDRVYQRALLEADYSSIGVQQRAFAAALRKGETRVTTPAGTDLRFRVGERPVNVQDGDASAARATAGRVLIDREIELPCGAIRVAPVEETVEGVVVFPPAVWDGQEVQEVRMHFKRGQVVSIEAGTGQAAVDRELAKGGKAARSFREFALGFNPLLTVPVDRNWIPYYGYGAGVVRLSLGDNSELGGQVKGTFVRWNFFIDASVTVGGFDLGTIRSAPGPRGSKVRTALELS